MTFTVNDVYTFIEVLTEQPAAATQLRDILLSKRWKTVPDRLDQLTETVHELSGTVHELSGTVHELSGTVHELAQAQKRTEVRVDELAQAQKRTEVRVDELAQAQKQTEMALATFAQRTEERLERLETTVDRLDTTTNQLIHEVRDISTWQRGEAGRRDGERYERLIARRAPHLFHKGQGGLLDQASVQDHLASLMTALPMELLPEEADPALADLMWWKGDRVVVVEISIRVDGRDVERAAKRANTLREIGVQAVGAVIGDDWVGAEARQLALVQDILWKVGNDISENFLSFRQFPQD